MREKKFVFNNGLAFSEEKEMKKLAQYAKEGWILESFTGLGYKLRKGEPRNNVYSLDYQKVGDGEYFSYFEEAGWTHVCSVENNIHIFCAPVGTKPIYTDKETTIEKYEREKEIMGKGALLSLITTIVFMFFGVISSVGWLSEWVGAVTVILGILSLIILIFTGLPYIAYQLKLHKLRKS